MGVTTYYGSPDVGKEIPVVTVDFVRNFDGFNSFSDFPRKEEVRVGDYRTAIEENRVSGGLMDCKELLFLQH